MELVATSVHGAGGDEITVLTCSGDLDIETSEDFKAEILPILSVSGARVIVDLTGVPFIDSTGLGALITAHKRAQESESRCDLVVATPKVERLLAITGLDVIIPIYATLESAIEAD